MNRDYLADTLFDLLYQTEGIDLVDSEISRVAYGIADKLITLEIVKLEAN
jgi:hypothetical protein